MSESNGNVHIVRGRDERGGDVFCVLVKRSYRIANRQIAQRADVDQPFRLVDEHYDSSAPDRSPVKHESEVAPYKAASDVVFVGKAYAPNRSSAQQMTVSVEVGAHQKSLMVFGNRQCFHRQNAAPVFSDPRPFAAMDIRYDLAYGGIDAGGEGSEPFRYPRNYLGRGVALGNDRERIEGLLLPNLEDPDDLLTPERVIIEDVSRWHLQPLPQGLGWRHRDWYPRDALLGTWPPYLRVGTVTAEERMGLLQHNQIALAKQHRLAAFEAGFNNGASLGLILPNLRGDERVAMQGLSPDGAVEFRLPGDVPEIGLDTGDGMQPTRCRLHTVSVRPDDAALDLIWCGAQPFAGVRALAQMRCLHAEVH